MTDEVGIVTGDLELRTRCSDDGVVVAQVRYPRAKEWYSVSGAGCRLHDSRDAGIVHNLLFAILHRWPS